MKKYMVSPVGKALKTHVILIKKVLLVGLMMGMVFVFSSCAMAPPDQKLHETEDFPMSTMPVGEEIEGGASSVDALVNYVSTTSSSNEVQYTSESLGEKPDKVSICYDATLSMMGFADVHGSSEYSSLQGVLESTASTCFQGVEKQYYRVNQTAGLELLQSREELSAIQNISFFLNEELLTQPEKVVLEGSKGVQQGLRMNEPVASYYNLLGLPQPNTLEPTGYPASQVIGQIANNDFVIFITDLEELQTNPALIKDIEEKIYLQEMVVGLTVLDSSFSGLVPLWSKGEPTWYEWGSQPTGSCFKMIDYGDYQIGLTIDPNTRTSKERPLYILCIGRSESVNAYSKLLGAQLNSIGISFAMSIFDSDFRPMYYDMPENISKINHSDIGMNRLNGSLSANVLTSFQLEGMPRNNRGDDQRWTEIEIQYAPRLSDPRIGNFTKDDFTLQVTMRKMDTEGNYGEAVAVSEEIATHIQLVNRETGYTTLYIRHGFPQDKLAKGQYLIGINVLVNAPKTFPLPPWVPAYDLILDNDDMVNLATGKRAFDGTKTIGLQNFLSAVLNYQQMASSAHSIGSYSFELSVIIP